MIADAIVDLRSLFVAKIVTSIEAFIILGSIIKKIGASEAIPGTQSGDPQGLNIFL